MSDHSTQKLEVRDQVFLEQLAGKVGYPALVVGLLGLIVAGVIGFLQHDHMKQFLFAYYTAYCYFLTICFGALFFVMIHHATRAGWSVVVRRLAEALTANFVLMAVLLIPVLFGIHQLFIWTVPHVMAHDSDLQEKAGYLNVPFFYVRCVLYFCAFLGLSFYFRTLSLRQDASGDPQLTRRMQRTACWGFYIYGFAVTFAAFDFLMGVAPHWFSTIFGVYAFAGGNVSFFSLLALMAMWLQRNGRLKNSINTEHYHDIGKWMFAWTFFWGYIAFSQYMLTWYANIPVETRYYLHREFGPWLWVSLILLFGQLLIPFAGLLSRHVKRSGVGLAFWAVWILVAHYVDMYWLIMPQEWASKKAVRTAILNIHDPYRLPGTAENLVYESFHAAGLSMNILCLIGVGGLFVASTMYMLKGRPLMPVRDPRLPESLGFENA